MTNKQLKLYISLGANNWQDVKNLMRLNKEIL